MFKRLISFVCCLFPVGAGAAVESFDTADLAGGVLYTYEDKWQDSLSAGSAIRINSGSMINDVMNATGAGVDFTNGLYVGQSDSPDDTVTNTLYIMNDANTEKFFQIYSARDVSIGTVLQVLNGWKLDVVGEQDSSGNATGDLLLGSNVLPASVVVDAGTSLDVSNMKNVQVIGATIVSGDLDISAENVSLQNVNATGSAEIVSTVGDVEIKNLTAFAGAENITIDANNDVVVSGNIQNTQGANAIKIAANGTVAVSGALENTGTLMDVSGVALDVSNGIKNDSVNSKMVLVLDSLTVKNEDDDEVSLFNRGNFMANITGLTSLENGFIVQDVAGTDTSFSLTTGQIDLGTQTELLNKLDSFALNVTNGNLSVEKIENTGGDMSISTSGTLSTQYLSAQSGNIIINATAFKMLNGGPGSVEVADGAALNLVAENELTAQYALSNKGNAILRSNNIVLNSLSNSGTGALLSVGSLTDETGTVVINGNVSNLSGETTIHAKSIDVVGVLNNVNGTTNVIGSDDGADAISIGGIVAAGGQINLRALAGAVGVDNDVIVNGGMLQLDDTVKNLNIVGNLDVYVADNFKSLSNVFTLSAKDIDVYDNLNIENKLSTDTPATSQWISDDVYVSGNLSVADAHRFIVGSENVSNTSVLNVVGAMNVNADSLLGIYSKNTTVASLDVDGVLRGYGKSLTANTGNIDIGGVIRFDETLTSSAGLSLVNTDAFELQTIDADIIVNDINVMADNKLVLNSAGMVDVNGDIVNSGDISVVAQDAFDADGAIVNYGDVSVVAKNIDVNSISNNDSGDMLLQATGNIVLGNVTNSAHLDIMNQNDANNGDNITVDGDIVNKSGTASVYTDTLKVANISMTGGALNLNVTNVDVTDVYLSGDMGQGTYVSGLNLHGDIDFNAAKLFVGADFDALFGDVHYNITNGAEINGVLSVAGGAVSDFNVQGDFIVGGIKNSGGLYIDALDNFYVSGTLANDGGEMILNVGDRSVTANNVSLTGGNVYFYSKDIDISNAFDVSGIVGQGTGSAMLYITDNESTINACSVNFGGIEQTGKLTINSSDITVSGDIIASDLRLSASPETNWMNVFVGGDVSGGVDFIGLKKMQIGGNYLFDDNSMLHAAILPYATGSGGNSTDVNYWANVSLKDDGTLGKITNAPDANPLISVSGKFSSDLSESALGDASTEYLEDAQVGIKIFDMIDQGTAIWLLHADGGVSDISTKIRNINVKFCNEDGSTCVAYFNDLNYTGGNGLPAYISVRDSDGDGISDSLYVVFDERFGGPAHIFPIQPIVGKRPDYTDGEYYAAGALDALVDGLLKKNKFYNKTPIEVLPEIFKGTHFDLVGQELYVRMEDYLTDYNGDSLANFSRLFANVEAEQIAGMLALNEHTSFRSFEDHLMDEFIWNRNRRLNKGWLDVDYGMFYQKTTDGEHTDGTRFNVMGGVDWQASDTLILGLAGRISHTTSALDQAINLSYADVVAMGRLHTHITDTNIGLGGYFIKTLGEKYRLYGNAFADVHVFDIQREQTFVDKIDGDATAFSLISEWGLLHDILNQYIVGNVYARAGYNFGFNISESISGDDYMDTKSDGYFILTPGYSLTAQKRIYPSAWFQIRPYASIGVEYDLLGTNDSVEYKVDGASQYVDYAIDIDPFWANIGGGFEVLSANGLQFGVDYRYQYNQTIQLHNIKLSGKYRF